MRDEAPEVEEQGDERMSPGARYTLGIAMILIGLIPLSTAEGAAKPMAARGVGIFCFLIAAGCMLRGTAARVAGRLVGGAVFAACVGYLVGQIRGGPLYTGSDSDTSVFNAAMAMVGFGLPGLYYALFGRLPDWASPTTSAEDVPDEENRTKP